MYTFPMFAVSNRESIHVATSYPKINPGLFARPILRVARRPYNFLEARDERNDGGI